MIPVTNVQLMTEYFNPERLIKISEGPNKTILFLDGRHDIHSTESPSQIFEKLLDWEAGR